MTIRSSNRAKDAYVQSRLGKGDDRTSREKLDADARLRGKVGSRAANKVIAHIDTMKSWR